jgi:hypothetical protein
MRAMMRKFDCGVMADRPPGAHAARQAAHDGSGSALDRPPCRLSDHRSVG